MPRTIIQIVRRFGLVGGMESYVWCLSHQLIRLGYQVTIICERCESDPDPSIRVIVLPVSIQRRRWKAMRDFNIQLDHLFEARPDLLKSIIHSHERTGWHHVTTFHGPPMKAEQTLTWHKKFSPRVRYWLDAEAAELCGPRVQRVVPVSNMVGAQLLDQYPEMSSRMMGPAYPALNEFIPKKFCECSQVFKLLFVGKEWKRKGLLKAVEISRGLGSRCSVQLDVFGVDSIDVPRSLTSSWVTFHGYQDEIPFEQYDLLIHPAVSEPFGMVVIEALSAGCRALVSDRVGAAEKKHDGLVVVELEASISQWVDAAGELLNRVPEQLLKFETWEDLSVYYHRTIYNSLSI